MRVVLATANPDKAREIAAVLTGVELVPRPTGVAEVEETADTLEGNARLKARALCSATGEPAVADDTGLEVDALGGRPGVWSARYAGESATYADNVEKLLADLAVAAEPAAEGMAAEPAAERTEAAGPSGEGRRARFRTVALLAFPDGRELVAEGVVEGRIAERARGGGGFGYDSVFVPDGGDGRTFAEMTLAEKNAGSHRARAFTALSARLRPRPPDQRMPVSQ